jgi:hypothetical protein
MAACFRQGFWSGRSRLVPTSACAFGFRRITSGWNFLRVLRSHEIQPIEDPGTLLAVTPTLPQPDVTDPGSQQTTPDEGQPTPNIVDGSPEVPSD